MRGTRQGTGQGTVGLITPTGIAPARGRRLVRALMTIDGDTLELVDLLFARPNGTPKRRPGGQVDLFFLERGRDLAPAVQLCA